MTGDFEEPQAKEFVAKYFGSIPSAKTEALPDISEPRQTEEKTVTRTDKLATKPAIGWGYQMPKRGTKEYYAMGLLEQILVGGEDSRLYQELVKNKKYTSGISGGINAYLGNMFNYNGPMLFTVDLIHDEQFTPQEILAANDAVIADIQTKGVTQAEIDRAIVKFRSGFYDTMQQFGGVGRADLLATFALFDDNPQAINQIEANFRKITPKDIQETAKEYLRKTNRTVVIINTPKSETDAE